MEFLWNSLLNHDIKTCTMCNHNLHESPPINVTTTRTSNHMLLNSLLNHNSDSCTLCVRSNNQNIEKNRKYCTNVTAKTMNDGNTLQSSKPSIKIETRRNDHRNNSFKTSKLEQNVTSEFKILDFSSVLTDHKENKDKSEFVDMMQCEDSSVTQEITGSNVESYEDISDVSCNTPEYVKNKNNLSSDNENFKSSLTNEGACSRVKHTECIIQPMAILNCHECDACKRSFGNWEDFILHKTLCSIQYPCLCQTCGNSIPNESGYIFHLNYHKQAVLNHTCNHCKKGFTTLGALRCHLRYKKPCKDIQMLCKFCGKLFDNEIDLCKHNENTDCSKLKLSYSCKICSDKLCSKASLQRHIQLKHEKNVRNYCCDVCGKIFSTGAGLRKHMMKHSERKYKCFECGRKFIYMGNLKTHMNIHLREMNLK